MNSGVAIGIVVDTHDTQQQGRVRIKIPSVANSALWARVVKPMVARSAYLAPEVGDQVVVAFESGDPGRPFVIGALWNPQDRPPEHRDDIED